MNLENVSTAKVPKHWIIFLIFLGTLQLGGLGFIGLMLSFLSSSGSLELGLLVGMCVFFATPIIFLFALINITSLLLYFYLVGPFHGQKRKLALKGWFGIGLSILISLGTIAYSAPPIYNYLFPDSIIIKASQERKNHIIERLDELSELEKKSSSEISEDEAVELLTTCKLIGFYYTNQTDRESGRWGELSSSGVVLTRSVEGLEDIAGTTPFKLGDPIRISIADRLISKFVPIARESQKNCHTLKFWYDGRYE